MHSSGGSTLTSTGPTPSATVHHPRSGHSTTHQDRGGGPGPPGCRLTVCPTGRRERHSRSHLSHGVRPFGCPTSLLRYPRVPLVPQGVSVTPTTETSLRKVPFRVLRTRRTPMDRSVLDRFRSPLPVAPLLVPVVSALLVRRSQHPKCSQHPPVPDPPERIESRLQSRLGTEKVLL